jgi:hypothetical protein
MPIPLSLHWRVMLFAYPSLVWALSSGLFGIFVVERVFTAIFVMMFAYSRCHPLPWFLFVGAFNGDEHDQVRWYFLRLDASLHWVRVYTALCFFCCVRAPRVGVFKTAVR